MKVDGLDDVRGGLGAGLELFGQARFEACTIVLGGGRLGAGEEDVAESGVIPTPRPIEILAGKGEISIHSLPWLLLVFCCIAEFWQRAFDAVDEIYEAGTSASNSECPAIGLEISGLEISGLEIKGETTSEMTSSICPGRGVAI